MLKYSVAGGLLLCLSLIGAIFTFNAWWPTRRWQLVIASFFASWITNELAAYHLAWQVVAAVVLVELGALHDWLGRIGLGIAVVSWAGLAAIHFVSLRSAAAVEEALRRGLGDDYRARIPASLVDRLSWRALILPFYLRDHRVKRIKNIPYDGVDDHRRKLDVYRLRETVKGAPVLLQIHGGAWILGDKSQQGLPLMLSLAASGWVCVAANYRLSPRVKFPDHLIDCKRALAWIRENIEQYGGDPSFVVVTGGSAGGHLASLLALTPNDPKYQPGFEDVDTSVAACVSFYGVYDLEAMFGRSRAPRIAGDRFARILMGATLSEDRARFVEASPVAQVGPHAPPFFLVHGGKDNLVPVKQARRFADALQKASKKSVVYAEIPGASHAFEVFHSVRTGNIVNGVSRFLSWMQATAQLPRSSAPEA